MVPHLTKPDPSIEKEVRKAYMELMEKVRKKASPTDIAALRQDINDVWSPREKEAFLVSMSVVGFVQHVIDAQGKLNKLGAESKITNEEFAAALLQEYLALSEGVFKMQLCHITVLSAYAGQAINIRGLTSPKSHGVLIRADISVEDLVVVAKKAGFASILDRVFSNPMRRAIAHMDVSIGQGGVVTFYETDKKGNRTQLGPPLAIADLQKKNFELRDFCHSLVLAIRSYAAGERGMGAAG